MKKSRRAHTLVELMITVAVVGLIASASAPLIIQTQRFFLLNRARTQIQREARAAMTDLTKNLRQAVSTSIVITQVGGQPYYSQISFTSINGRYWKYYQNGSNLYVVSSSTETLSQHLRYMAFFFPRNNDMTIVSVSMTMETSIYQGRKKALHVASERVRVMD